MYELIESTEPNMPSPLPLEHDALRPAPRRRYPQALYDLIGVVLGTSAVFFIAARLELYEAFSQWITRYERYQADELPFALLVLAAGLFWYAFRRWREARAELALRIAAETRVAELLRHNRELAQQLISLQENERRALARELHDEVGQCCNAIRVEAAYIQRCGEDDRYAVSLAAERIAHTAEGLYQLVRNMLRRLRPAQLDELGLVAAIQELCESWEERSRVACVFHSSGRLEALGDAYDITLYRVVQEALSNVMRHAQATSVRVTLSRQPGELHLNIQDDGIGMTEGRSEGSHGLGLLGVAERAASLGGRMGVESASGAGWCLAVSLPIDDNHPNPSNPSP